MSPTIAAQFTRLIDLVVILVVLPYVYSAVATLKVIYDRRLPRRTLQAYAVVAVFAVAYCVWAVLGGSPGTVVAAFAVLLISVPLYAFFLRSMEAAKKRQPPSRVAMPPVVREKQAI
jgi:arginine:agmatine antiporter